ncbi:MAG: tRNA (adenosine(37)-N6)-threonylcarbamoyltransferase complex ATPase subunit type 1 TsaE [Hydrogenothermaceae bacterium]|nr:tRNA (adenosine(37)-N6)-threonylcarbamoyltransferase complex ATPase subunit type 1 TsaE [Hydrogenothermaceae bacterium]
MTNSIIIKDLQELESFAEGLARELKGDEIILLEGELGAGKTTLTKLLLKHLGVKEDVTSPTFTVMNEYSGRFHIIYHIDMYRLNYFDISDIAGYGVIVVEWPKGEDFKSYSLPVYRIKIEVIGDKERVLRVEKF